MKKTMKLLVLIGVVALIAFAFCGCGGDGDDAVTNEAGSVICPLDGQVLESAEDHGDYVIMVSIDNGAGSEPQSGIGKADLLMEIPVEGGINRFFAFFYHNTPDTIGPVRSARHYVYDVVKGFDAVFAHCGGSPQAYDVISSGTVKDIDEMGYTSSFWRTDDRKAPHNLYTSYENLSEVAAEKGYTPVALADCPAFNFMTQDDVDALTFGGVTDLLIPYRFKQVLFQWDEEAQRYQRYSASDPSIDAIDDSPVMADNVVVLYVSNSAIAGDDSGRLEMSIESGSGLLLQYGNAIDIEWTLTEGTGFVFTDAATGEELKLVPGKTIINIADPNSEPVELTETHTSEEGAE